jgi:hypothetical protein
MTAAMASALPPVNGGSENDPVPQLPLPEDECPENPDEDLCTVIVVTAPSPEPTPEAEAPDPTSNWDIVLPLGGGVSVGARRDANKRLDLLLVKLDKRLAELQPTCESTTGNFFDGWNPYDLAEGINLQLREMNSPGFQPGDFLPTLPELEWGSLTVEEYERRWDDALEYLRANGFVYDKRTRQWKRFECA